jgi:hypothetical protein
VLTGAVYVYDIGKEDDTLIASSGVGENAHKDPISQVTSVYCQIFEPFEVHLFILQINTSIL